MHRIRQSRGISLLELAIVLGVGGLLLSALWMGAAAVLNEQKKSDLINGAVQTMTNARALFAGDPSSPDDFTQDDAVRANLFPDNWLFTLANGNIIVRQPFARSLAGDSAALAGGNGLLSLTLGNLGIPNSGIAQDACVLLLLRIGSADHFRELGLVSLEAVPGNGRLTAAVTPAAAAATCDTGGAEAAGLEEPTFEVVINFRPEG